jgi:RimJ/RimL family protein N-acetyltransferase
LSAAIVNAVIEHAAGRVEQILLAVAAHNHRAIRFYERMGFKSFATEPRALKVGGRYVDELLMIRFLDEYEKNP